MGSAESQMFYVMLALPTLFGLTLVSEGMYKMTHYESGWTSMIMGIIFLAVVAFGLFFLKGGL